MDHMSINYRYFIHTDNILKFNVFFCKYLMYYIYVLIYIETIKNSPMVKVCMNLIVSKHNIGQIDEIALVKIR